MSEIVYDIKKGASKGQNNIVMQFSLHGGIEYSSNVNKLVLPFIKTQTWQDKARKGSKLSHLTPFYGISL